MDFQTYAAILFIVLMVYFVYKNREKITFQHILFPVLYFAMYRTKFGLKFMDGSARKFPRLFKWLAYAGIIVGFLGMGFLSYSLVANIIRMFQAPAAAPGVALVLPFKLKGSFYVPFFYWIISIFVLAVVHEFSHGIVSRVYNLKIKSSGFAFLGVVVPVIPAAFVEPDEKQMEKASTLAKLSVYSAGPFSNIIFAALVALLLTFLFVPLGNAIFDPTGIEVAGYVRGENNMTFPAEQIGIDKGEVILKINGKSVLEVENFTAVLEDTKPGQSISIQTNESSYTVSLAKNPEDENKSYLGVYVKQKTEISKGFRQKYGGIVTGALVWIIGLFYWLYVLNLGIGLFNLVPLGPIDGGRMLLTVLRKYLRKDIAVSIWKLVGMVFLFIIIASVAFAFVK